MLHLSTHLSKNALNVILHNFQDAYKKYSLLKYALLKCKIPFSGTLYIKVVKISSEVTLTLLDVRKVCNFNYRKEIQQSAQ